MNAELPTLDLAVATHRPEGIRRVASMVLPPMPGVRYIVSWQSHGNTPVPDELSERPDVVIHRFDGTGLSNNRNNAIDHATADIILFADDDVIYYPEGLRQLRQAFADNPKVDFITLRSHHGDLSRFPDQSVCLRSRLPKGYSVASFEIAFRRSRRGALHCCPELGLGAPRLHGGEDEMFLLSAIKRGFDCRYFPITIGAHPHESTGTKAKMTDGNLLAAGCVIALTYPWSAVLRLPLKALRLARSGRAPFFGALLRLCQGALTAPALRRRHPSTLW